ncbi:conserved hypothetical protein [Culex quinquefasciatus]|uniref:Ionotropic glutamate receptor L-glutamate and glycine-binding domain-containing protein n=1 Tax=Culex quinquefasciatus TaxID=7176 RepID=B0X1W3_CULQU|nr:conserved hypothetical protein [Culex quinquefasciatus]|eukprot:XP_001863635.1 conserved hypothetical protein [Culex quinquefasciatus]
MCILHDSPSWIWIDLLDEFIPKIAPNMAVNRLDWIGNAPRKCEFHLIFLDSAWRPADFNRMVHLFLEAHYWNRYGMFVFVVVEDANFNFLLFQLYTDFAKTLGIVKSVLILISRDGRVPIIVQHDYFKRREFMFKTIDDLKEVFLKDYLRDVFGYQFDVLFFLNAPFLFITRKNQVLGVHRRTVDSFAKHVNASLELRVPKDHVLNSDEVSQFFWQGTLFYGSLVNDHKMAKIERFTLFALSVILFLLCESYLAKLFQFLFNYQYEPHLESIDDLLTTNHIINTEAPFFKIHLERSYPQLQNRVHVLSEQTLLHHPEPDMILGTLCHTAYSYTLSNQNFHPTSGLLRHYVLPARISLFSNSYSHSRRQPFSTAFNRVHAALHEAGLLDFWFEVDKKLWLALPQDDEVKVVKFGHLVSLWKLVAAGYGIAWVVFGIEIVGHWILLKIAKKK